MCSLSWSHSLCHAFVNLTSARSFVTSTHRILTLYELDCTIGRWLHDLVEPHSVQPELRGSHLAVQRCILDGEACEKCMLECTPHLAACRSSHWKDEHVPLFLPPPPSPSEPSRASPPPLLPLPGAGMVSTYKKWKAEELSKLPGPDWVVVLASRAGRKPLVEVLKLRVQLLKWVPATRIVEYTEGSLSVARRKDLLNRARLLVAVHGAALADMVFMPPGEGGEGGEGGWEGKGQGQ